MVIRAFFAGRSIRMRDTAAFLSRFFRNSRTAKSSASMVAKLRLPAYQRDDHARVTGSRKPVGWIFCPMGFPRSVADRHVDVAGALADAVAAALGARAKALQRGALLDVDRLDLQLVDVGAVVVLGIRDGAVERLQHDAGGLLLRELQDVAR